MVATMVACAYPIYTNLWFWLLAIGLLFFAIGVIIWDVRSQLANTWWVWLLIAGGALLFILGLILAIYNWWRREAMTTAMATLTCQDSNSCPPDSPIMQQETFSRVATPRRSPLNDEPITIQTSQRRLLERNVIV